MISEIRSAMGAADNRLKSTVDNLSNIAVNAQASLSKIEDANFAEETAGLTKFTRCITGSNYEPNGYSIDGTTSITSSTLYTAYSEFKSQLATTRTDITNRITEISNRIGYVNSKDVAIGGIDSGTTTKSKDGTLTKQGFEGYTFNGGKGYANTIYSHANFLAGKKIKLFEKIITAINDVQALYDQVKSKRSQYYEYNQ